ncbi:MAG TPA: hypothetical protein VFY28_01430 [Candidatus Paceibacterota bacterium]|nr:hypothetical protein [Candidatus Paceibacterota bacterium]
MAKTFHLTIAKVGENLFDGESQEATLPGADGVFTILAEHEAFVTPLKRGTVAVTDAEGKKHSFEITQGVAEVSGNQATILL